MTKCVPFTAHVQITPVRGKRFETWRDMQKIAAFVYEALTDSASTAFDITNIATPGGTSGFAVKPQFGESPAQAMITGFYESTTANAQPHQDKTIFSGGEVRRGPGAASHLNNPTDEFQSEVSAFVVAFRSLISDALQDGLRDIDFELFRLDYGGVVYGDRGYHFP